MARQAVAKPTAGTSPVKILAICSVPSVLRASRPSPPTVTEGRQAVTDLAGSVVEVKEGPDAVQQGAGR